MVLRDCRAGRRCRWTQFLSIGIPQMPHNAFWDRSAGQVNVTGIAHPVNACVLLSLSLSLTDQSQRRLNICKITCGCELLSLSLSLTDQSQHFGERLKGMVSCELLSLSLSLTDQSQRIQELISHPICCELLSLSLSLTDQSQPLLYFSQCRIVVNCFHYHYL